MQLVIHTKQPESGDEFVLLSVLSVNVQTFFSMFFFSVISDEGHFFKRDWSSMQMLVFQVKIFRYREN